MPTPVFRGLYVKKCDGIVGSNPVNWALNSYGPPKPNNSGFLISFRRLLSAPLEFQPAPI